VLRRSASAPGTERASYPGGPYAITRHPIYTGLPGMVLGTMLVAGLGLLTGRRAATG
jgi:protein-S-isoprenylcysteine O-methyltransferase Ste14